MNGDTTYAHALRELRALAVGSVFLDSDGDAWQLTPTGWTCIGFDGANARDMDAASVALLTPITVIHRAPHPSLTGCPRCDLTDTSAEHNGQGDCPEPKLRSSWHATPAVTQSHVSDDRCLRCGGVGGAHGKVHVRHGNGGGHNEPCPLAQEPHER